MANDLVVVLSADSSNLQKGLDDAERMLIRFSNTAHNITNNPLERFIFNLSNLRNALSLLHNTISTIIGTIQNFVNGFVQLGDALDKASIRTGISVDSLGGLKFAVEQCGGNFESLINSIRKFSSTVGDALNGDAGSTEKLSKFGINAEDLRGKDVEEQFKALSDHLASIHDQGLQAKMAIELFGQSGYEILPMLKQGSRGIEQLVAEGRSFGAVMGKDATDSAAALSDAMNRMHTSVTGLSNYLISYLAPAFTIGVSAVAGLIQNIQKLIDRNSKLILSLGMAAAVYLTVINRAMLLRGALIVLHSTLQLVISSGALLIANPWATVFIAAAAALFYFTAGANKAADVIGSLTDNASKYTKEVENNVKSYQSMFDRLQELQRLSETDTLNNEEVKEANGLIAALTDKYGDLGIKIDATTRKITGMTEAQTKMAEAQKQEQLRALETEQSEYNYNIKKLDDRIKEIENEWSLRTKASKMKELDDLNAQRDIQVDKRQVVRLKIYNLTHKPESEANAEEGEENLAALTAANQKARSVDQKELDAASRNAQNMAKTIADSKLNKYQLRIQQIDEQAAKALADFDIIRKDAVNKGDKDKIAWVLNKKDEVETWANSEKDKVKNEQKEYVEKQKAERAELVAKGTDTTNDDVKKAQNKVNELQETINDKYVNGEKSGKDNRSIDTLKKELQKAQVELAKTVADVSGKARVEARDERDKELAKYNKMKVDENVTNEELQKQWAIVEQAERKYKEQDREYNSAVGTIQAAQEERANNQISAAKQQIDSATTQGTFSAWETGSIGNSTAKEQLITMKKMLDELIGINKNTEEGAVTA